MYVSVVLNPADCQVACADELEVPMKFGTMHGGGGAGVGAAPKVTVIVVAAARQSLGDDAGLVVCVSTLLVFWPFGLNEPENPADVHVLRASPTVEPIRLGTRNWLAGQAVDAADVTTTVAV